MSEDKEGAERQDSSQPTEASSELAKGPDKQTGSGDRLAQWQQSAPVVGKTIFETDFSQETDSSSKEAGNQPPPLPSKAGQRLSDWRKNVVVVAKTILDVDACRKVVSNIIEGKEVDAGLVKKAAPDQLAPAKESIACLKASPCNEIWNSSPDKSKVSFCDKCHLQVYDFSDMTNAEAESLVFQREERKNVTLYKRKDGKYLTSNCPVGLKARQMLTIATAACIAIPIVLILLALMSKPPQPPAESPRPVESKIEPPSTPNQAKQDNTPSEPAKTAPNRQATQRAFQDYLNGSGAASVNQQPHQDLPADVTTPQPESASTHYQNNVGNVQSNPPVAGSSSSNSNQTPANSGPDPSAQRSRPASSIESAPPGEPSRAPVGQSPAPVGQSPAPVEQSPYVWQRK